MNTNEKPTKRKIAQLEKQAAAFAAKNQWQEAAAALLPLAHLQPDDAARWLLIAQWQRAARDFRGAIETLQSALQSALQPGANATSSTRYAAEQLSNTSFAKRVTDPVSAREIERIHLELAENFAEAHDWTQCIEASHALLRIAPRNHNARELLATSYLHTGRVLEAEQTIRELLQMSPRDPLHRLKLATLLQIQSKSGESLEEFKRVVAAFPEAPFAAEAREAIELLDNLQIQQVMMRLNEQPTFEQQMRYDLENTLRDNGFHLTDEGRESLRHMMSDGRPENAPPKIYLH